MTRSDDVAGLLRALQAAARSSDGEVSVRLPSVVGMEITCRVLRVAGGKLCVTIVQPYKGPKPGQAVHLVDPTDPDPMSAFVDDIDRMFGASDDDRAAGWVFGPVSSTPDAPVDEDWREGPGPADLLTRLERLRAGRGGVVSIAAVEAPLSVVHLRVSGRRGDLQVRGTMVDLARPDARSRWRGRWRLSGDHAGAVHLLAEVEAALRAANPEAGARPSTLAIRLEVSAAARAVADAGFAALVMAALVAILVGYVLYLLKWPMTGVIAEVARMEEHSTSPKAGGSSLILIAIVIGTGAIPAHLLTAAARRSMDIVRLPYGLEAVLDSAAAVAAYLAWVGLVILTPVGAVVAKGAAVLFLVAILLIWGIIAIGWFLEKKRRP